MWQCKMCGNKQDLQNNICEGCGTDLLLHGKVVVVGDDPTPPPPSPPPPPPPPPPIKRSVIAVIALLAVAAGLLVWMFLLSPNDPGVPDRPNPSVSNNVPDISNDPGGDTSDVPEDPSDPTPNLIEEPGDPIAHVPDFLAFAESYAQEDINSRKEDSTYYGRVYFISSAGADQIAEEYLALLETNYNYQRIGNDTLGEASDYYWFRYTGAADVSEFTLNITLSTTDGDLLGRVAVESANLLIRIQPEEKGMSVQVVYAKEIRLQDNGYRTSYTTH